MDNTAYNAIHDVSRAWADADRRSEGRALKRFHVFPQTWGKTCGPFGGLGGNCATAFNVCLFYYPHGNCWLAYVGGRFLQELSYDEGREAIEARKLKPEAK